MKFRTENREKGTVMYISGNLMRAPGTADEVRKFQADFLKILEEKEKDILILDLSEVDCINASGIALLIECYSKAKLAKKKLKLMNPSEKVISLLNITHLFSVFDVRYSTEEALEDF